MCCCIHAQFLWSWTGALLPGHSKTAKCHGLFLEERTCHISCMMHTFPNFFFIYLFIYLLDLWYVHFAENVPLRLGSLPGPPFHHHHPTFPFFPKQKCLLFVPHLLVYLNASSIITCNEIMILWSSRMWYHVSREVADDTWELSFITWCFLYEAY